MSTGKSSRQNDWERFSNFKQRGEWVELQFMAQAARRRFAISKPWGETQAYDVGIEYAPNFLRVQVKSTTYRMGAGYLCQFKPNHKKKRDYSLEEIDLFAAYVIPEDAWYLIPAVLLLGRRRRTMAMLCPMRPPAKKASYCYEGYREAWNMLNRSRTELAQLSGIVPSRRAKRRKYLAENAETR
ncbi:MAG: group I intron-associated PD-(D/E)XK endonuclease [Candidatus Sulfotelmatobacter sp.]